MHLHHIDLSRLTSVGGGGSVRGENSSSFRLSLPRTAEKYMWRAIKTKDSLKGSVVHKHPFPYVEPCSHSVCMGRVSTLIGFSSTESN